MKEKGEKDLGRRSGRRLIPPLVLAGLVALAALTWLDMRPLPPMLAPQQEGVRRLQIRDRTGQPLSATYLNPWNYQDLLPLHEIPPLLQAAFIQAEDRRFFRHSGVDWAARLHALGQNLRAGRVVRGASTITEQVVRLLHPRPRTVWSRWLEGWEAYRLEGRFAKGEILTFYLNQVPYAARRRGVVQAARYYFDRDLATLNPTEMLSLAVLVRAPGRLDLRRDPQAIRRPLAALAKRLEETGLLTTDQVRAVEKSHLVLTHSELPVDAGHFIRFVREGDLSDPLVTAGRVDSTLDAGLQRRVQSILGQRLSALAGQEVSAGAVLVADYRRGEILAWANGRASGGRSDRQIDAVRTPRQPGSALKPFLYALAIEDGWTAATLLDDAPLASPVGGGQHPFHNYSRRHYGPIRLREALGNSLNIPAVLTARFVGPERFLQTLHALGLRSLDHPAEHYGLGLALGNGEVTLLEMVGAYNALAEGGLYRPLVAVSGAGGSGRGLRVFSAETASVVADILADPDARLLEFGRGSLLNLPLPTAVKTGTSTDFRDAWAVGFNHRYTVGVWLGNLDRRPMRNVTGATGPALVLRAVFAELNRPDGGSPLYLSPRLAQVVICRTSGLRAGPDCPTLPEWFLPGKVPPPCDGHAEGGPDAPSTVVIPPKAQGVLLRQPTPGLQMALDPRIPDALERFPFVLPAGLTVVRTEWLVDGMVAGTTGEDETIFFWPLKRGRHQVLARIRTATEDLETEAVGFVVK